MIARYAIPFFIFMSLVIVPAVLALLCRWLVPRRLWHRTVVVCTIIIWTLAAYGFLCGFQQFRVRRVEYASADLPACFDGYRIVQFSDAHVGTLTGSRQWMVQRAVDSINAQRPDAIVFTGDMQNVYPDELLPQAPYFRQLKAPDGVFAVLGNHDYAVYQDVHPVHKERNCRRTVKSIRQMGFDLLLNEHRVIRRDSDSIVVAGMENWGTVKRMPREGDVRKTLEGVTGSAFVVMLQHDPTAWRAKILPECRAQLTLSGHTHGGQFSFWGWSPAALAYDEWGGKYHEGDRALCVSTGLGGLIPFRLNLPGEIVVITLKSKKKIK